MRRNVTIASGGIALLCGCAFGQGTGPSGMVVPIGPPQIPVHSYAVGQLDPTPGLEVVRCNGNENTAEVWTFDAAGTPTLLDSFSVTNPLEVDTGDFDADGFPDIAIVSGQLSAILIYINDGTGHFQLANSLETPFICSEVVTDHSCGDGYFQVYARARDSEQMLFVNDPLFDDEPIVIDDTMDYQCPEAVPTLSTCDNRYVTSVEGECSTTPVNPGIVACMEAADCLNGDCKHAACVLYAAGNYGWFRYTGAIIACAAVADAEIVGCVAAILP